jgi:hypothetical protein
MADLVRARVPLTSTDPLLMREAMSKARVLPSAPDRAAEPVRAVVGQRDRLGVGGDRQDGQDRRELLALHHR